MMRLRCDIIVLSIQSKEISKFPELTRRFNKMTVNKINIAVKNAQVFQHGKHNIFSSLPHLLKLDTSQILLCVLDTFLKRGSGGGAEREGESPKHVPRPARSLMLGWISQP